MFLKYYFQSYVKSMFKVFNIVYLCFLAMYKKIYTIYNLHFALFTLNQIYIHGV